MTELCPCRGASQKLQFLHLRDNQFTGTIPASWAQMPALVHVYLSYNRLSGPLPTAWDSKAQRMLRVEGNQLTGLVPVWPAPNLKSLAFGWFEQRLCSGNRITGQIPPTIAKLMPRLKYLGLQCNDLSGTLPAELGSLTELTDLIVSNDPGLGGTLPSSLGKLSKLKVLDVAFTSIQGTVPESFGGLTQLELYLHSTKMSGCVPASLTNEAINSLPIWPRSTAITGICN